MTDPECIHGLDPSTCSLCLHPQPRRKTTVSLVVAESHSAAQRTIQAAYDGFCGVCREPIYVGDLICRDADDESWVHEECA